jgi:hypothetical protein
MFPFDLRENPPFLYYTMTDNLLLLSSLQMIERKDSTIHIKRKLL